jgi:CcmD family protein
MTEVKYVAAAYLVVFLFVLVWVLIHATKLQRLEREVARLSERAGLPESGEEETEQPARAGISLG